MVCRKVMRSRTPHYIFSLKAEDLWRKREQRSRLYLGKLRATSAQDYVLYDNGICEAPEESVELLQDRERGTGGEVYCPVLLIGCPIPLKRHCLLGPFVRASKRT
jgi:hypothetical protein